MKLSRSAAALATAAILAAAPVGAAAAAEPEPPAPATTAAPPLLDLDRLDGHLGALLGNVWYVPRDLLVQLPCTLRRLVDPTDPCPLW